MTTTSAGVHWLLGGDVCSDTLSDGQKGDGNAVESGGGVSRADGESDGGGADGSDDGGGVDGGDGNGDRGTDEGGGNIGESDVGGVGAGYGNVCDERGGAGEHNDLRRRLSLIWHWRLCSTDCASSVYMRRLDSETARAACEAARDSSVGDSPNIANRESLVELRSRDIAL